MDTKGVSRAQAVVFDLDGTLVDTYAINLKATQHVLRRFLGRLPPEEEVAPHYGVPLREIMAHFAPGQEAAMVAEFEAYYLEHQEAMVRPFAGVSEMLGVLRQRGYPLAILSNKRKEPGLRELRVCGLAEYFRPSTSLSTTPSTSSGRSSVLFLEDLRAPKPAPEALRQSAALLGVDVRRVLYVGDSVLDVLCARGAGARSAAALWAAWDKERVLAQGPDHVVRSVEELLALCP